MKAINKRLDDLEKSQDTKGKPLWIVLEDGEPIPEGMEGVKIYSPLAHPDLWDEEKSEVQNAKNS
jgi:hypothetical protein